MLGDESRERIARIGNKGERKVAGLLSDIGLAFLDADVKLHSNLGSIVGEIDLAFESGNMLLLVEVSTGKNSISDKKWNFFNKWGDGQTLDDMKSQLGRRSCETIRAYFDLRPKPGIIGGPEAAGITKLGSMNQIYYQDDFERMSERVKNGNMTVEDFLADFTAP